MARHRSLVQLFRPAARNDGAISMINVVFLLLLFFLIAGQIAPPLPQEVALVDTDDMPSSPPPGGVVIHADGRMMRAGEAVSRADILAGLQSGTELRLVPDRGLPAKDLVRLVSEFRAGGAREIRLVTLRGSR